MRSGNVTNVHQWEGANDRGGWLVLRGVRGREKGYIGLMYG